MFEETLHLDWIAPCPVGEQAEQSLISAAVVMIIGTGIATPELLKLPAILCIPCKRKKRCV